jgi:hypothetical protein
MRAERLEAHRDIQISARLWFQPGGLRITLLGALKPSGSWTVQALRADNGTVGPFALRLAWIA